MKECPQCGLCAEDGDARCPEDGCLLGYEFAGPRVLDGKYRLVRRIGSGGMGTVYEAVHTVLGRLFAVKLIGSSQREESYFRRFRREARMLGMLKHPNIVDVTDFGVDPRDGGIPYLVMEHLEGETLHERRARCPRMVDDLDGTLTILDAIARAIDFAHERQILHRDLKPANIFLSRAGGCEVVKVLDFGIARVIGQEDDLPHEPRDERPGGVPEGNVKGVAKRRSGAEKLTRPGTVLGTPEYLSPEQAIGVEATDASDIYCFGLLAYESIVGRHPFTGDPEEMMTQHVMDDPPRPSAVNPRLPRELDEPLLAPLLKAPEARPVSATNVVDALREALGKRASPLVAERYRLGRLVGSGQMSDVFEAVDETLGQRVALKILHPELANDPTALFRFRREINVARRITHPNVARIFDIGQYRDELGRKRIFISMELIDGETLEGLVRSRGKLSPREALPIVRQMVDALAAAHAAGIVHRDLKSSDVLLVGEGEGCRAVLIDFGMARSNRKEEASADALSEAPRKFSPEEERNLLPSQRSDIYALGVVLEETVEPDARWEAVIRRCLEPRPEDRFESVRDLLPAL